MVPVCGTNCHTYTLNKKSLNRQGKSMVTVLQKKFLVQWRNFHDFVATVFSWVNEKMVHKFAGLPWLKAGSSGSWIHTLYGVIFEKIHIRIGPTKWYQKVYLLMDYVVSTWNLCSRTENLWAELDSCAKKWALVASVQYLAKWVIIHVKNIFSEAYNIYIEHLWWLKCVIEWIGSVH